MTDLEAQSFLLNDGFTVFTLIQLASLDIVQNIFLNLAPDKRMVLYNIVYVYKYIIIYMMYIMNIYIEYLLECAMNNTK